MRPVLAAHLIVTVILVAGCSGTASSGDTSGVTAVTAATDATLATHEPTGATTYEAVILGPGDEPVSAADIAPRLFRDEPSISEALKTAVPAGMAARSPGIAEHLIVAIHIAGAAETPEGVEVYGDVREEWFSLEGEQAVEYGGATYPVRIRLSKVGGTYHVDGVDRPRDGSEYLSSIREMVPSWARDLVGTQEIADLMQQAIRAAALEWAAPFGIVTVALPTTTTSAK